MNADEQIAVLQKEVAELRALVQQQAQRIAELEARLGKDSHNSSKPPSSDGYRRRGRVRPASGKPTGGQRGHEGTTLTRQAQPDQVVRHRPTHCGACQQPLHAAPTVGQQVRQVHDLPQLRLAVTDHIVEQVRCTTCAHVTSGQFPAIVTAPVQYGPQVQALAVYLNEGQLLPSARTVAVLRDLLGAVVSEGSLETWVQQTSTHLAPFVAQATRALRQGAMLHGDETGVRIGGQLHWLHVACTARLTLLGWHAKRGHRATEDLGVWPGFTGLAVHDRWATYWRYASRHALCHAHLQRELTALVEQGEEWAAQLQHDFQTMYAQVATARQQGRGLDAAEQDQCWRQFYAALNGGYAAHPAVPIPKRRGRPKQAPAKNLLDALRTHADAVLAFITDPRVPLTNNQAERDLRMAKVQQKISGTFRSEAGATAFCRIRSYLASARKQGQNLWHALIAAVQGTPLLLAQLPE